MALKNDTPGTITISGAEYVATAKQYVLHRGADETVTATLNDVSDLNTSMSYWTWEVGSKKFLTREFAPQPVNGVFGRTDQYTWGVHTGEYLLGDTDNIAGYVTCTVTWSCLINGVRKYFQTPKATIQLADIIP